MEEEQAREEEAWLQPLPAFDDLVQRFSLFSTSARCNTQIGYGGSLYCKCEGCSEWRAFVEGRSPDFKDVQYEVFTLEHVKGLAHYLLLVKLSKKTVNIPSYVERLDSFIFLANYLETSRRQSLCGRLQAAEYKLPVMNVLEVGAGGGRLCQHLNYFLAQPSLSSQGCVVQLTATDSGKRGLNGVEVVKQDAIKAISEAMPHVVLVSWMPIGIDWTAHMRATPSVLEYILIGEIDGGICGDPWLTWGHADADCCSDNSSEDPTSLSISDGPLSTSSFSNYRPGKPADIVQMGSKIIPFQFCIQQGNLSEQLHPPTVEECKRRDVDILKGNAQNPKKLKLCPESLLESSTTGELHGAISGPMSSPASASAHDTHENPVVQLLPDRKNVDVPSIAPHKADGWVRIELASLSSLQVCRTDERWSTLQHSHTVSFQRNSTFDTHKLK